MDGPSEVKERSQRRRLILYREWFPAEAESLCRRGAATAHLGAHFGVHERTIRHWAAEHPEFGQALQRGRAAANDVDRAIFKAKMREAPMRRTPHPARLGSFHGAQGAPGALTRGARRRSGRDSSAVAGMALDPQGERGNSGSAVWAETANAVLPQSSSDVRLKGEI